MASGKRPRLRRRIWSRTTARVARAAKGLRCQLIGLSCGLRSRPSCQCLISCGSRVRAVAMQAQLAHSKAQLLGVIEAVRAQPEGVPCSMGQKQVLASIKIGA